MFKKIFPHIFVVLTFWLTFSLGYWQLERMTWKNELLEKIESRISSEPMDISEYKNMEDDEFKYVTITGEYLHDKEVTLLNRTYNGKPGVHIYTPLKTADKTYLVSRGWVRDEQEYNKPEGIQMINGLIRKTQVANWISLENSPEKGQWFWIELEKMYKSVGLEPIELYIDRKIEDGSKDYPLPLPKKIQIHNEHLQYTITWFSLSITLLVIYYFRFWYRKEK